MSFAAALEKATGETQQTEEWQAIMDFSDKVSAADESGRTEAIQALTRRLTHTKTQVQLLTISVLTSCVKNCGRPFQASLCNSREFFPEVKRIVNSIKSDVSVVGKLKELLLVMQKEFRDAQQRTVAGVINSLKDSGIAFDDGLPARSAAPAQSTADSEDADLRRALAESLKLAESKPPSARSLGKARALFDFDATEENELAVRAGEVVTLLDTSDSNWWRGRNAAGEEGCFPAKYMAVDAETPAAPASSSTTSAAAAQARAQAPSKEIDVPLLDRLMKTIAQMTPGQPPPPQLDELMAAHNAMKPTVAARTAACTERKRALEDACSRFQQTMARFDAMMQAPLPPPPPPPAAVYYPAPQPGLVSPPLADPRLAQSAYAPQRLPPQQQQPAFAGPGYPLPGPASYPAPVYAAPAQPPPPQQQQQQQQYLPPSPAYVGSPAQVYPPSAPAYAPAPQAQWQYGAVP